MSYFMLDSGVGQKVLQLRFVRTYYVSQPNGVGFICVCVYMCG